MRWTEDECGFEGMTSGSDVSVLLWHCCDTFLTRDSSYPGPGQARPGGPSILTGIAELLGSQGEQEKDRIGVMKRWRERDEWKHDKR